MSGLEERVAGLALGDDGSREAALRRLQGCGDARVGWPREKPGVADEAAGDWEGGVVACEIAEIVVGLALENFAEDRMPLSEALLRLRAVGMGDSRFDAAQHHEGTDGSAEGDTAPGVGSGGIAAQPSDASGSVMAQADDEERGRVTAL